MCNLYSITRNREAILHLFRISDNRAASFDPQPAIFPAYNAPVVRQTSDGERELVTNVRDDKILKSSFWKPSFAARRCLVPASSYCEPNGRSPATWYWFAVNGEGDRPLFTFPGIWQRWKGPIKKDGLNVENDTYAFMTTGRTS